MDDGAPTLEVGFAIDTGDSFGSLTQLDELIDRATANAVAEFAKVEKASAGMLDLAGPTARITSFGNAATKELRDAARELSRVEKAGESMSRQLERQAANFGKTREEIRATKAETAALAAEQQGLTDLAGRLRSQEAALAAAESAATAKARAEVEALAEAKRLAATEAAAAAEVEAQAIRSAARAHEMFEARARQGTLAMREQEAAAQRDAATLARLRAMIDPAATAQDRLNAELVEARRVMTAAGASAQELAAAEDALWARSARATQQHDLMAGAARRNGFALQTVALQLPDITQGLLTGQRPMTVFIQQGFQIVQVAQMAEGGLRGFGRELTGLALRFAPFLAGLAVAGAGFALFTRWISQGVTSDQLTRDLGKITGGADATKQELFKLKDATVSWGDVSKALFSEIGKDISEALVGDIKNMSDQVKTLLDDMTFYGKNALAGLYAGVAGTKAYLGEIEKGGILGLAKMAIGQGDPKLLEKTYGAAYDQANAYLTKLGARVKQASVENARQRLAEQIGYNNQPKPKTDHHAEQLARQAVATEAQIRNLYRLADAYGVSGAAALIAEARVKAETDAIRKRGDIEAGVDRQVRLAIAQRVADGAKSAAAMGDEARMQTEVNALVADNNVPAERAAELLRERIAELPLLAAIEAAQQRGLKAEADKATKALEAQRSAQADSRAAQFGWRFAEADAGADKRLAELREELRLVGVTDEARVRALATLRATQEAQAKGFEGAYATDYIAKQVQIAVQTQQVSDEQRKYNDELRFTGDLLSEIDQSAQNAARGMADAFGKVGSAIGDAITIMTGYYADQARLQEAHDAALLKAGGDQKAIARENALYATRTATQQVAMYGSMASAAKGFFKQHSVGYKAMETAEKAFRAIELAMAIRNALEQIGLIGAHTAAKVGGDAAMAASDTARAAVEKSNSLATIAVDAVKAVVKAISGLPFPLNLAAGAATIAALAGIGVGIAGGFGGKNTLPKANEGTGSVLGDSSAKSESIKRAIDALKEVDTLTNTFAREMAASLKSIDSQIGGLATVLVRAGNIDASAGVNEGFKTNAIGSVLKAVVPIFGGVLSSLFGSKTTVVGNGLFGGPQSVGSINAGGFDASYYSDVEKKKKFFGITTGTSYSTKYGAADPALENQFTLILRQFNAAIVAAAGPLGEATGAIQSRLNGFIVDIGKIDLKDLTGEQIQEKLNAIFGAAADGMANAAFPGIQQFQKVGEGAFETLVRVASTVEAVSNSLDLLSQSAQGMGVAAKLALADQFDSVSDLTSAADAYFQAFYSKEEQTAAKTAQMTKVFGSLGLVMPTTIAAFRQLVEAQDLTTDAGQGTYATLLKLAPAFADLRTSMEGVKSAADVAAERQDLERKLLELRGDTAALRALDLAKLDASNRGLQQQIYAVQDAQDAAKAAEQLRQAWTSVGDGIAKEIERIRGLSATSSGGSFASLQGQFNAANAAARAGDQDAAKSLPGLSQALLSAAALVATSRQEIDRVQAQTAATLEATNAAIRNFGVAAAAAGSAPSTASILAAASASRSASTPVAANDDLISEIKSLRDEVVQLRSENNSGHATTAGNVGRVAKTLDNVTAPNGGDAISVAGVA